MHYKALPTKKVLSAVLPLFFEAKKHMSHWAAYHALQSFTNEEGLSAVLPLFFEAKKHMSHWAAYHALQSFTNEEGFECSFTFIL